MKRILLLALLVCASSLLWAQTVRGTIVDAGDNSPLPGATVAVKGTNKGAITDINGAYTVNAEPNDILVVTYAGYLPYEQRVGNRKNVDIRLMQDQNQLEGVVITAMGLEAKKEALGYATTVIGGTEILESQRGNWINALASRLPGGTIGSTSGAPGASSSIMLRGVSSLFGSNQPLIVIDGVQTDNTTLNQGALVSDGPNRDNDYTNRAADLNSNDIESVTVLKGPEAAALYGAVAGNGAIIITTKKGAQGDGRITYDNSFRFEEVYRIPEVQRIYGRGNFGLYDPLTRNTRGPRYADNVQLYDNVGNFFRTGTGQRHNLVLEGGTEKMTYRWSNNFSNAQGVMPGTQLKSLSSALTGSVRIRKKLNVETRFTYNNSTNDKVFRGANGVLLNLLTWPADENILDYETPEGGRRRLFENVNLSEADNPLFNAYRNLNQDRVNRFRGSLTLVYDPTTWLTLRAVYGSDRATQAGDIAYHPESNAGFTLLGYIENYISQNRLEDLNTTARARAKVGKFGGALMVGSQTVSRRVDVNSFSGQKLFDPNFYSVNNTDPTTRRAKNAITRSSLVGLFSQLELNYNELIYVTLTGRNDWTSTLPVANRSYFYPSIGGSVLLHKLLPKNNQINYLKARASYAQVAKDAPPHRIGSALASQTTTGGGYALGFFGGNAALRPERTNSSEFGLEGRLLKDRITFDVAYFYRRSIDQITPPRTSYGTGFVLSYINSGIIDNWGYEASLGLVPIKRSKLTWTLNANFTRLNSNAVTLPLDLPEFYVSDTWLYDNIRNSIFKGRPLTTFGATQYLRNNNGDILISPNTGLPVVDANFTEAGDRNPDFTIGVNNQFTFGNFNFSFLLDVRKGGDVFNGTGLALFRGGFSNKFGIDRETPVIFNGVLQDGRQNSENPTPNNIVVLPMTNPNYFSALAPSDFIQRDINWLRLREVSLSYSIPASVMARTRVFRSGRVFLTGNDLLLLTNYTGADPTVAGNSAATPGSGAIGFDYGSLPNPRAVSFGLRVGM